MSLSSFSQGLVSSIGGTYGSEVESLGMNIREYYFFNHHICLGPEVSYFPKHKLPHGEVTLLELNITGHYILEMTNRFSFYPLTGLNYSIENVSAHKRTVINKALGVNLGIGFHYRMNNVLPFIEYKYITGNLSQNVYSAGILIMFRKKNR